MELQHQQLEWEPIFSVKSFVRHVCPECAAPMVEADRLSEYSGVFIWYRCSRLDCAGSWLQKIDNHQNSETLC